MNHDEPLFRQVAAAQDQLLARVSSVPLEVRRVAERPPRVRERRLVAPLVLTLAAVAAVVLFVSLSSSSRARPLTVALADGRTAVSLGAPLAAPADAPVSLAFSDGSTVTLAAAARARVTHVGAYGAAIVVERGRAEISVVPRKGNDWGVDVGPFHVAVKGTRFSLAWDPESERFDFDLEKGRVVITGACLAHERALTAGESLHASCRWSPADEPPAPAGAAPASPAASPAPPSEEPAAPPSPEAPLRARAAPAWQKLASAQRYTEALAAAERGGFANECRRRAAPELLVLGDVARLAGSPTRAVEAYTAARAKRTTSDRSAFSLGLVEFDQRRDFRRAATWFATYLSEQPRGPLAEQAEGRAMDAWQRAGEPARARAAGESYLARHPHGEYADLARRLTLR